MHPFGELQRDLLEDLAREERQTGGEGIAHFGSASRHVLEVADGRCLVESEVGFEEC